MTARETLRGLTVPLACLVVALACLTAVLQVPRWTFALAAEITEALVVAGKAATDHLAGQPVAVITTVPLRPQSHRFRRPTGGGAR